MIRKLAKRKEIKEKPDTTLEDPIEKIKNGLKDIELLITDSLESNDQLSGKNKKEER